MKLVLTLIAIAYLSVVALLFFLQRSLLYFPSPTYEHDFETLTIENDGELISIVVLNPGQRTAILYFGGNAESIEQNLDYFIKEMPELALYLPNYRGFGRSTGKPSQQALFADALEVYRYVKARHEHVFVIGGASVYSLAIQHPECLALHVTQIQSSIACDTFFPEHPAAFKLWSQGQSMSAGDHRIQFKCYVRWALHLALLRHPSPLYCPRKTDMAGSGLQGYPHPGVASGHEHPT